MAAAAGSDPQGVGLTFGDFLAKMKDPAAADLVRNIKSFIRQFEERPSGHPADPEADSAAVQAFLAQSEAMFRQHPVWRGCQPEVLDQAVEGLEKYVMSKVWRQTFGASAEDRERDERYQRLMQALGFVDLPTLMGAQVEPDETLLGMAQAELLKMDRYKAPRDKLLCLVNVKTMVENIVGLAARAGANIGGADAFFPVLLFVLIRSRLPRLASNVEYVKRFRMRARLSGQFDYMLCNLESCAMYLDTVNYEHLAVSQEAFLRHLAAAGIPEAHLELRRIQQDAEAAAAGGAAAAAGAAAGAGVGGGTAADYGTPEKQLADAAAVAAARQGGADDGDVLAGLWLADGGGTPVGAAPADGLSSGLGSAHASMPATPTDAAASLLGGGGAGTSRGDGSAPTLTPVGGEQQSPVVLGPSGAGRGDGGSRPGTAASMGSDLSALTEQLAGQQAQQGGAMPRGLSFESAAELASTAEQQEQRRQQQRRSEEERAAAIAAAAAAAEAEQYAEAALIEEMVAEGTRHVLAAEAAGQLQRRYPYMYAQAEDLSLADVQAVLAGYKELLLRYEALSRSLQQQLGLGGVAGPSGASPVADAEPRRHSGSGHKGKEEQRERGIGSMIAPGLADSAQLMVADAQPGSPASLAGPAESLEPGPSSASGRWSPGGLLQRITSKGRAGRSPTPPRERDGGEAAAEEVVAHECATPSTSAHPKSTSPGKQAPHPIFSTLFSSSSPKLGARGKPPAQEGPAAAPPPAQAQSSGDQQQQQPAAGTSHAQEGSVGTSDATTTSSPDLPQPGSQPQFIAVPSNTAALAAVTAPQAEPTAGGITGLLDAPVGAPQPYAAEEGRHAQTVSDSAAPAPALLEPAGSGPAQLDMPADSASHAGDTAGTIAGADLISLQSGSASEEQAADSAAVAPPAAASAVEEEAGGYAAAGEPGLQLAPAAANAAADEPSAASMASPDAAAESSDLLGSNPSLGSASAEPLSLL